MSLQGTYLERIIAAKRAALGDLVKDRMVERDLAQLIASGPPVRDFAAALRVGPGPRAIAEFKRASPSEGRIREHADPKHIAQAYVDAGAACISVLTDPHFEGSFDDLRAVANAVDVPVLCKDFILSRRQIVDARRSGAAAVLLIVAVLEAPLLRSLLSFVHELGMQALCEAHDERELDRAMAAGARIIGVNSRDLRSFEVDLNTPIRLRHRVPASFTYVAESGIRSREDVHRLRSSGVDAILVGTHLMRADDPGLALDDLMAL